MTVIARLSAGRHPRTQVYVGKVRPFCLLEEWQTLQEYSTRGPLVQASEEEQYEPAEPCLVPGPAGIDPSYEPPFLCPPPAPHESVMPAYDAEKWTIEEVRRAKAGGQHFVAATSALQKEVDDLNRWTALSADSATNCGKWPQVAAFSREAPLPYGIAGVAEELSATQTEVDLLNEGLSAFAV